MKGIRKKTKVLKYSLNLERFVSTELATLFDIKDYKNSKSFGNGTSSLGINQKLNLLLDVKNIDKKEKETITNFMSIRNQFMHNIDADNYTYVIKKLNGLENKLKREYPENFKDKDIEKAFGICIEKLYTDSLNILLAQKGNKLLKTESTSKANVSEMLVKKYEKRHDSYIKTLEKFVKNYPDNNIPKFLVSYQIKMINIEIDKEMYTNLLDESGMNKNNI